MSGPVPLSKRRVTVNAAIYGEPGSGKTILAASSPKPLILDADFGVESAALHFPADADILVWKCEDFNDLEEAQQSIRNGDKTIADREWVWLDSGSLFQERTLHDQIMRDVVIEKPTRNEFVPDVREYLIVQNQLAKAIRHFCGMNINFGFTAYPESFDLGEKREVVMPMLAGSKGKYIQKVCGYLNFVGSLGINQDSDQFQNRLLTRRAGQYYAKNRFGLPPVIDNPNMTEIAALIDKAID